MRGHDEECYGTLEWIIKKSEHGMFLAVADEETQNRIADIYKGDSVGVCDYGAGTQRYSFVDLKKWADDLPGLGTLFIVNFQLAVQSEEDLKRLNFSRDMLAGLGKNLIFFTTAYGDDMLAKGAYDFYSFLKLRICFHEDGNPGIRKPEAFESVEIEKGYVLYEKDLVAGPESKAREWMKKTYILEEEAKKAVSRERYRESEWLIYRALRIREALLGTDHLEMAGIYWKLARLYGRQEKWAEAEGFCKRALSIREKILGEDHPDTVAAHDYLGVVYKKQSKYREAEELESQDLREKHDRR